jgi:hypothetical protein
MLIRGITDTYTNVGRLIRDPHAANGQNGKLASSENGIHSEESFESAIPAEKTAVRRRMDAVDEKLSMSQAWDVTDSVARRIISLDNATISDLLPQDPASLNFVRPRYV